MTHRRRHREQSEAIQPSVIVGLSVNNDQAARLDGVASLTMTAFAQAVGGAAVVSFGLMRFG